MIHQRNANAGCSRGEAIPQHHPAPENTPAQMEPKLHSGAAKGRKHGKQDHQTSGTAPASNEAAGAKADANTPDKTQRPGYTGGKYTNRTGGEKQRKGRRTKKIIETAALGRQQGKKRHQGAPIATSGKIAQG